MSKPTQALAKKQRPSDVLNQIAMETGGTHIPLFRTLSRVGITRPEEQKLFFDYARSYGGVDPQNGDFMVPKDAANRLWDNAMKDKDFQMKLDGTRIAGIDRGLLQVNKMSMTPEYQQQMTPQGQEIINQQFKELTTLRSQIIEQGKKVYGKQIADNGQQPNMVGSKAGWAINATRLPLTQDTADSATQQQAIQPPIKKSPFLDLEAGTQQGDPHKPKLEQGNWGGFRTEDFL